MKLLNITTKYFLILLLTILTLWTVVFYFVIKNKIYQDVDEYLENRKFEILKEVGTNPSLLSGRTPYKKDFKIEKITPEEADKIRENYSEIFILEPVENEPEAYRQLTTTFSTNQEHFKLSISASLVDSKDLIKIILINVSMLYFVLLVFVVYLNRKLLQKLWKPFYSTLLQVKKYRLERDRPMNFEITRVIEFRKLNEIISQLIQNNLQAYQNQKQFIENVSHEIQTPLAIARSKTELLMENSNLTGEQAKLVDTITENLNRLSRLSKSLLLLSKIENNQFPETEKIDIESLIRRIFEGFKELIEFKNIKFNFMSKGKIVVELNSDLAEILFSNLIRNAIYHNVQNGFINLSIKKNEIVIENSGLEFQGSPELFFERFSKASANKNSLGLGLSIVKSICNLYHFNFSYITQKDIHKITLQF